MSTYPIFKLFLFFSRRYSSLLYYSTLEPTDAAPMQLLLLRLVLRHPSTLFFARCIITPHVRSGLRCVRNKNDGFSNFFSHHTGRLDRRGAAPSPVPSRPPWPKPSAHTPATVLYEYYYSVTQPRPLIQSLRHPGPSCHSQPFYGLAWAGLPTFCRAEHCFGASSRPCY